jgi:predicted HTH transcriptional regulator
MEPFASIPSSMHLSDLRRLVTAGENTYIEFKREIPSTEKIAREISAIANTHGGTLLIGVDDDGSIVGVQGYEEQEYLLDLAVNELCIPPVDIRVEIVPISRKRDVLVVTIREAQRKPVAVQSDEGRQYFVRERDKSVKASPERVALLRKSSAPVGVTFEFGPNEQKLLRYLDTYGRITVHGYADLIQAGRKKASGILVNLTSAGILQLVRADDETEWFSMSRDLAS